MRQLATRQGSQLHVVGHATSDVKPVGYTWFVSFAISPLTYAALMTVLRRAGTVIVR